MKVTYPVIFTDTDTNILVEVPDLGIYTESNSEDVQKGNMADAMAMARDAIGRYCISEEDAGEELKTPSSLGDIKVSEGAFAEDGEGVVSFVDVDLAEYRRRVDNRTVRRNVTLPNWLNLEADKANINVSKVLQEALMSTLQVARR